MIGKNSIKHHYLKKEIFTDADITDITDITDADYAHAKRVRKDFETKHLGKYHDLYVQGNRLLIEAIDYRLLK